LLGSASGNPAARHAARSARRPAPRHDRLSLPLDVELWRHWASQRTELTPEGAEALADHLRSSGLLDREAPFISGTAIQWFVDSFGVLAANASASTPEEEVGPSAELVAVGHDLLADLVGRYVHPALAITIMLYRAGPRPRTGQEGAYPLLWPLRDILALDDRRGLEALQAESARLLRVADAEVRAACAAEWKPLVAAATAERERLLGRYGNAFMRVRAALPANWKAPSMSATYPQLLSWLRDAWWRRLDQQRFLYPHEHADPALGIALQEAARRLLVAARLSRRWQYGMEYLVVRGTAEGFWEQLVLKPVWSTYSWITGPNRSALQQAQLGFAAVARVELEGEKLLGDLIHAVDRARGAEEAGADSFGHDLAVLFRDLRARQLVNRGGLTIWRGRQERPVDNKHEVK
jgi:hypothetical protein